MNEGDQRGRVDLTQGERLPVFHSGICGLALHTEIQRDNPELRQHEELFEFLTNIYGREREVSADDTMTVIQFSRVDE